MTGPKEGNKSDATQLPKKPTIIFPIMPPGTSFPKIAPAIAPIIPPTINAHRKLIFHLLFIFDNGSFVG